MSNLRIGIVGGGPGGLITAIALKRKGFKNVKVFERDANESARQQGYSYTLFSPNGGLEFLEKLNLVEEMDSIAFKPNGFRVADAVTGKLLMAYLPAGHPEFRSRRVLRSGMRKLLLEVCKREGVPVVWNAKFVSYEEKGEEVIVRFEGLEEQTVDILIGADGLHSGVRKQLVGDELRPCGYSTIMALIHRKENPELFEHPWMNAAGIFHAGPGVIVFSYHHPPDELYVCVGKKMPHGELSKLVGNDKQKMKEEATKMVANLSQLAKDTIISAPVDEFEGIIEFCDRDPLKVDRQTGRACNSASGRITLIGDAAHPMMPFRAAGGNNAILDAWRLTDQLTQLLSVETLQSSDITKAFAHYEQEMVSRTTPEVLGSRKAAADFHEDKPAKLLLRNAIFGMVHWKMNTYDTNKWVQWGVKGASLSAVATAGLVLWKKIHG